MRFLKAPLPPAALLLLTTSACEPREGLLMAPDPEEALANAEAAERPQQPWTSDAEFARAARAEAPGFAGYHLRDDGTPVILLADPRERGAAERYLAHELAGIRSGRHTAVSRRPEFRTVRHDFAQLKSWFDALESVVELREDVYLLDLDEVNNRLHAGVRDQQAIQAVRVHAAGAGIPAAVVHVEIQPAPEQRITVRDRTATLIGGFQIAFSGGTCTLGFNAVYQYYWTGVTNSHCTPTYFGDDGGAIMQNTWTSVNKIGSEVRDRGLYACYGSGTSCRRSDAAYVRYIHEVRYISKGGIARTAWASGGPGGLTVTGEFDIVSRHAGSTPVGTYLDKTGRTTGSTYGQVTASCVTIGNLRCQDISTVYSELGDSGSPMHVWIGGNQTELYGILWGGPQGDFTTTYSSRLAGIEYDLGPLSHLCRDGYGC